MNKDRLFFWRKKEKHILPGNINTLDRLFESLLPVESADLDYDIDREMLVWSSKGRTLEKMAIWQKEKEPYFRYGCLLGTRVIETDLKGRVKRNSDWIGEPQGQFLNQKDAIEHFMKAFKLEGHSIHYRKMQEPTTDYQTRPDCFILTLGDQIRLKFYPDNKRRALLMGRLTVTVIPQTEGEFEEVES